MLSHAAMVSARGVSLASAGIQPSSFWRLKVRSRSASQPSSNLPLYLSAHSLKMWCGPCAAPGAQYMKNGLSGENARCLLHPRDRLVRQVFAQVVFLVVRRLDRVEVLEQPRLPLRGLAGEKAVEVVEADALAGRPERERPHRRGLGRGRVVPLAEGGGLVSVVAQDLREGRGRPGNHAGIAVPVHRALGDGAGADALMIAPGQQRARVGEQIDVVWNAL